MSTSSFFKQKLNNYNYHIKIRLLNWSLLFSIQKKMLKKIITS